MLVAEYIDSIAFSERFVVMEAITGASYMPDRLKIAEYYQSPRQGGSIYSLGKKVKVATLYMEAICCFLACVYPVQTIVFLYAARNSVDYTNRGDTNSVLQ
jgi:hypothetical protein